MADKKLSEEEKSVLEQFMIPFFHLEKRFPLFPGKLNKEAESLLLGISRDELTQNRANLTENSKQAALELLKEDEIIDLLEDIPLDGEETIVALGDSITEDAQGWFEILRQVLEIGVEDANFTLVNSGVAYNTTADALRRVDRDVLMHEPDWVFVALGTFDVQRLSIAQDRTLLPLSETWENLNTIQEVVGNRCENPILWVTPTPVIEELLVENPIYEYSISERDLVEVRELIAGKTGGIVDPRGLRMGENEAEAWNYIGDGLHHSLSGHMNTVREVLRTMAEVGAKSSHEHGPDQHQH